MPRIILGARHIAGSNQIKVIAQIEAMIIMAITIYSVPGSTV